jgi:hypothetical protein
MTITLQASAINAKNQYITTNNQCYDGLNGDVEDTKTTVVVVSWTTNLIKDNVSSGMAKSSFP